MILGLQNDNEPEKDRSQKEEKKIWTVLEAIHMKQLTS